jgi:PhzF family phenazine biosynthesis protein
MQIDAFTNKAFQGNSAAVVLLPQSALPVSDSLRQAIAMENNLSETAFVECSDRSDRFASCSRFRLRWFTPAIEVPLCGHATLAAAAALFFGECNGARQLAFDTLSGELVVTRQPSGDSAADPQADLLSMDLPLIQATGEAVPLGMGRGSALVKVGRLPPHPELA